MTTASLPPSALMSVPSSKPPTSISTSITMSKASPQPKLVISMGPVLRAALAVVRLCNFNRSCMGSR
uniref:Uncharacterized protein n=1 Tax=Romanomermis culicivorax TaxID=13658 RepID=A0A915JAX6_ROMCU